MFLAKPGEGQGQRRGRSLTPTRKKPFRGSLVEPEQIFKEKADLTYSRREDRLG